MNIFTFNSALAANFTRGSATYTFRFSPGVPYILARPQLTKLHPVEEFRNAVLKQSLLDPRIQNFHVKAGKPGQRVLIYNGCGGYGDQIMTWPVAKELHRIGYRVTVLVDPGNAECWERLPFINGIMTLPVEAMAFEQMDHLAFFEVVSNLDEHTPQLHATDAMMYKIGIDWTQPEVGKTVAPSFSDEERNTAKDLASTLKSEHKRKNIAMYQLASASKVRSLSPGESLALLTRLAESYPDTLWLAVHDGSTHTFSSAIASEPWKHSNVVYFKATTIRSLWALTQHTRLVIAPDSMMVHVAGSLDVPCIGLWGPTSPDTRVKYYCTHVRLEPESKSCPLGPCHCYTTLFPTYCPSNGWIRSQCSILDDISFDAVIEQSKPFLC